MENLKLINSKKDLSIYIIIFLVIFSFNIFHEYFKYKDLTSDELFEGVFQIENIYDKKDYQVLKIKNDDFNLFTSINKEHHFKKLENIKIAILTNKIDFISFLKGFYAKSVYYEAIDNKKTAKHSIYKKIITQHSSIKIQELFSALFLAIPISKEYRQIYTNFGISHLIAISGFHLSIISFFVFFIVSIPYKYFHSRYFLYRNKKYDISLIVVAVLLAYLVLTNFVPSLFRAFVMFSLILYFLRRNYEVLSFQTLFIAFFLIIALFPKYLFSISFGFSIAGVFYIYLYLHYFKALPKIFSFFLFNIWIFLVFNPIVHFFFYNTSLEQLISPFLTLLFILFYPLELALHIFGFGNLLDEYILMFLNYKMVIHEFVTPSLFFYFYVFLSFLAMYKKSAFILLNILFVVFNLRLYIF